MIIDQTSAAEMRQRPLVVINGCPRSGTSFLNALLAKRLNAALMPETHFIPLFEPYLWMWGGLKTVRQRQRLIEAIFAFTEIRLADFDLDKMRPYCILVAGNDTTSIAQNCHSYPEIVEALFEAYRAYHRGSLVVEKTAYYSPPPWSKIAAALPSSKFLHVIRDGRDVALSWRKTWFGPKSMALCAQLWAAHVHRGLEWEKANPDRCLRVRYESLTRDTDNELDKIGAFLNVPILDTPVQQSSIEWLNVLDEFEHMKNLNKSIIKRNSDLWKNLMTASDLAIFEALAGDTLELAGYERSLSERALLPYRSPTLRLRTRLSRLFSPVELTRNLAKTLPLAIWLSGLVGLSLPKLLRQLRLLGLTARYRRRGSTTKKRTT